MKTIMEPPNQSIWQAKTLSHTMLTSEKKQVTLPPTQAILECWNAGPMHFCISLSRSVWEPFSPAGHVLLRRLGQFHWIVRHLWSRKKALTTWQKLPSYRALRLVMYKKQIAAKYGDCLWYICNQPMLPTWHGKLRLKKNEIDKQATAHSSTMLKASQRAPFVDFQHMTQAKISQHNSARYLHNFEPSMDPPNQTIIGAGGESPFTFFIFLPSLTREVLQPSQVLVDGLWKSQRS